MRIHLQRKLVLTVEHGQREIEIFDPAVFPDAADVQVAIIPDEQGLWLTIVQETPLPLDQVRILPGFHRISVEVPPDRPKGSLS